MIALAAAHRTAHVDGATVSVYVLYLDGHGQLGLAATEEALGMAVEATCFAVFKQAIHEHGSGIGTREDEIEAATLLHEMGHLLGLVGMGAVPASAHEDAIHPRHCSDPECVMSWLLTTGAPAGAAGSRPSTSTPPASATSAPPAVRDDPRTLSRSVGTPRAVRSEGRRCSVFQRTLAIVLAIALCLTGCRGPGADRSGPHRSFPDGAAAGAPLDVVGVQEVHHHGGDGRAVIVILATIILFVTIVLDVLALPCTGPLHHPFCFTESVIVIYR